MSGTQRRSYFESQVLTAPPQRLHLMLIEGALRFGREAEKALTQKDELTAAQPLLRMLDILGELLAAVRAGRSELNSKLSDLYAFFFRRVAQAKINADVGALQEVLRLLEYERETWQLVCKRLGDDTSQIAPTDGNSKTTVSRSYLSLEA